MPLPWKKHRFSQLVADLQSPSQRRRSLIVQTGFPTSLVDLFVKNRDRLRKTSSRKHSHKNKHGHDRGIDSSTTPPPTEVPVRAPPLTIPLSKSSEGAAFLRWPNREQFGCVEATNVAGDRYCDAVGRNEAIKRSDGSVSFANRVFAAVLKTFVVVALALSTKKLVVGITLSAFALLLLEFVGKHMDAEVGGFLKPCSDASKRLLGLVQMGLSFFRPKKTSRRLEKGKASKRLVLQESSMLCDSLGQIETLGDSNFEEEIGGREEDAGLGRVIVERKHSSVDMSIAAEGNEDRAEEALLYGKNQGRSSRFKSKIIKQCVPKKLRDLRRKKKSKGTELEDHEKEEGNKRTGYFSIEELEDCGEDKLGGENNDKDDESQIPQSCEQPLGNLEGREKLGRGRERNSGYGMLILIVLVGLVGGRIWALVLTVVWCLLLKSLGNPRRVENVPMMRSLISIRR